YYDRKIALGNEIFGKNKRKEEALGEMSLRPFFNAQEIAFQNIGILSNHMNANSEWFSQEGIFRISPQYSDLKEVLDIIDNTDGVKVNEELASIKKSNAICSALKKQLGLALTDSDKMKIYEFAREHSNEKKHYFIPFIPSINKLPLPIKKIMPLLIKIIRHEDENKMSASNIAKMIAPYVTPTSKKSEQDKKAFLVKNMQIISFITDLIDSEDFIDLVNSRDPLPKNPLQKSILSNT
ncbi:RhoGAP domain-containing protein, partial [Yersinia canariae]